MADLEKKRLREVFKKQRLALTAAEVEEKSKEICQNFIENLLPRLLESEILKQVQDDGVCIELQCQSHQPRHPKLVSGSRPHNQNPKKTFSLYLASNGEVSTEELAQFFQKNSLAFSYPKIIQKNQPLEFILASHAQQFAASKFYPKILEPISGNKVSPNFLILPLLAFDHNLSRLGMGGGFFDRTILQLKVENPQLVTIGLGYDFQRSRDLLPTEKTDQKLDFIVTEKNIFSRS